MADNEGRQVQETYYSSLQTVKTSRGEYDALIMVDLSQSKPFFEMPAVYIDVKMKTLQEIYGFSPTSELKKNHRIAFREVSVRMDKEPSNWAVFARIQKGVPPSIRKDVIKSLNNDIRAMKETERQHYYINEMTYNYLEKLAKDYNFPKRDAKGKFHIVKYGTRALRGQEAQFPVTGSGTDTDKRDDDMADFQVPKKGKAAKSPHKSSSSQTRIDKESPSGSGMKRRANPKLDEGEAEKKKRTSSGTAKGATPKKTPTKYSQSKSSGTALQKATEGLIRRPSNVPNIFASDDEDGSNILSESGWLPLIKPGSSAANQPRASTSKSVTQAPLSQQVMQPAPPSQPVMQQASASQPFMQAQPNQTTFAQPAQPVQPVHYFENAPPAQAGTYDEIPEGTIEVASTESVRNLLSIFGNELTTIIKEAKMDITGAHAKQLRSMVENDIPNAVAAAIEQKLHDMVKQLEEKYGQQLQELRDSIEKIVKEMASSKKSSNDLKKTFEGVIKQQGSIDRSMKRMKGSIANTRAAGVELLTAVLPFQNIGVALDIFLSADICRRYLLYYMESSLDAIEYTGIMNNIAQKVIDLLFTTVAGAHFALGDTKMGRQKMLWYKRCVPKSLIKWLKGPVISYVKRQFGLKNLDVLENFIKCRGGLQNRFSNDRQKMIVHVISNCRTSDEVIQVLYNVDRSYAEDTSFASPNFLKKPTFEQYKAGLLAKGLVKTMHENEENGLKPKDINFAGIDHVLDNLDENYGAVMTDIDMYKFIAKLAQTVNVDPKTVTFTNSEFVPNIHETYLELINNGTIKLDGRAQKFKLDEENRAREMTSTSTEESGPAMNVVPKAVRPIKSARGLKKAEREGRTLRVQIHSSTDEHEDNSPKDDEPSKPTGNDGSDDTSDVFEDSNADDDYEENQDESSVEDEYIPDEESEGNCSGIEDVADSDNDNADLAPPKK